jgi:formate hydrogenlyase transcriptional activator
VFPIFIASLLEGRLDITLVVSYLTILFGHRVNKKIETVATETMNALVDYSWPGNIRELQNVIERAVLISNGPTLKVPLSDLAIRPSRPASQHKPVKVGEEAQPMRSVLEEVERKQILAALEQSRGIVAGPNGAAALLGLKRSTLQLRMKKLGINSRTR